MMSGEPKGIGGWLILPSLGLLISPFVLIVQLMGIVRSVFAPGVWAALTSPGSPAYHPLWGPLLIFEMAWNVGYLSFFIWVGWKFFAKKREAPKLFSIALAAVPVSQTLDAGLMMLIPAAAAEITLPHPYVDIAKSTLQAVIWISYFHLSKRVQNTFVN